MFLSDITNNQEHRLLNGILSGDKKNYKIATYKWPLWSSTISKIYYKNYKSAALSHEKNLGHWTVTHFKHSQFHPFLYSPSLKEICHRKKTISQWFSSPVCSQASILLLLLITIMQFVRLT